jgi:phosphinothricin acetyltransferase
MGAAAREVIVRAAMLDDAEAIRAIYNHEVEHETSTMDTVPRTPETQRAWIAARSGALSAWVAVDAGEVVGFGSLSEFRDRFGYRTTVEDSVYVRRDRARRGVGRALLGHLVETAHASGFHTVIAHIEAGGAASRALHAACGFELVGVQREVARKFGRWVDMAIMQRMLRP